MVVVLLALLFLSVLAATYVEQGVQVESATTAITGQRFASARAEEATQLAIARIKAGQPGMAGLVPCSGPSTALRIGSCSPTDMITVAADAPGLPPAGGWQFQYWIFRPAPVLVAGIPIPLSNQVVNVYAEGYFGAGDAGMSGFTVSAIEAEVLIPKPPGSPPVFDADFGIIQ